MRESSKTSNAINMADRLRDLIDLVLSSLDDPDADGAALAERAHFSRDHLDRLLAAATGESPVALRRRLLLERAAWQLRGGVPPAEARGGGGLRLGRGVLARVLARLRRAAERLRRRRAAARRRTASTSTRPPAC